jgi:hypothetical protein
MGATDGPTSVRVICTPVAETRVLFANGWQWRSGLGGMALRVATEPHDVWRIHQPDPASAGGQHGRYPQKWKTFEIRAPRALALIDDSTHGCYALLSLSPSLDGLDLHTQNGTETIYKAPERIEKISVCPCTGLAVMLTVHKKIVVYAVPQRALRVVLHGEGASDASAA